MAEKIFYTMGEVAEMFDVNTSLIRHWESQFPILRPKRNKKGNRLFTPQDVEHLKMIYHLVKECGMTLDGARKALRKEGAATAVERDAQLMEHLQRIRSLLVEVREDLKADNGQLVDEEEEISVAAPEDEMPRKEPRRRGASAERHRKPKMEGVEPAAESVTAESVVAEPASEPAAEPVVTEVAAEPAEPASGPVAESVTTPAAEVAAEPASEPAAEPVVTEVAAESAEPASGPVAESVTTPASESAAEPASEPAAEPVVAEVAAEPVAESAAEPVPGQPTRRTARKPRRKKEEVENKELFAFYEQSLF